MPVRRLGNPFWSEKLQEELDLRDLRPATLPPVPGDDAEVERELDGGMEPPISDQQGSRNKVRGRSRDLGGSRLMEEGFETPATPASWVRHGKGVTPTGQSGGEVGRRSEGEMPYVDEDQGQSLERALEKELVSKLHDENQRLKKELEEMQLRQRVQNSRVTPSSWSAVTPDDDGGIPGPPPPRSRSPVPRNHDGRGDGLKYTPNGTRVPDGPPPGPSVLPDLPAWPFGDYETCEAWAPCLMSMGSCWKGPLQAGDQRGGMQSRQELQGGYKDLGHGVQSRQEHQDRFQGSRDGMYSRQGEGHSEVMSAAAARAAWLERELKQLQTALTQEGNRPGQQRLSGAYWSERFQKGDYISEQSLPYLETGELRKGRDVTNRGRAHENRAYASHEGTHEDRALASHGRAHEDRALAGHGRAHEDRALASHGRAHEDRDLAGHGRAHEDRALAGHGRDHEDRAFAGHGRAHEDRAFAGFGRAHDDQLFANGRELRGYNGDLLGRRRVPGDRTFAGSGEEREVRETTARGEGASDEAVRDEKDHLKAMNINLPTLPSHTGKESGLACGDWLVQVRPLIGDMSGGALQWWDDVLRAVTEQYNRWLLADPLQRLHLPPPAEVEYNTSALRKRLDIRTSTLLLAALPSTLKSELVSARQMATGEILYRIMRNYQPGGLAEKSETLQALSVTQAAKNPKEATEKLQRWRRHQLRAQELGATLPDASILCKALGVIASEVLLGAPQASFRLNSFRLQSRLDVMPTAGNLEQFYQMLLAEMETLALNPEGGNPQQPSVKAMTTSPGASQSSSSTSGMMACKFWGSEAGCKQGKACKFEHANLEDARDRCWNCSSTTHRKASCPYKTGGQSGDPSKPGPGPPGGSGGGGGKGGKSKTTPGGAPGQGGGKNGKTSEKSSGKPTINKAQTSTEDKGKGMLTSSTTTTTGGDGDEGGSTSQEQGITKNGEKNGRPQNSAGTGEADSATLMSEVTSLLRSMRMSSMPQLSAISIKRLDNTGARTTLLDGGATHCLRPMVNQREWDKAQDCKVALATGSVDLRQVKDSGTLITQDASTQRIIPIRELVRMGLKIVWKNEEINMTWQDGSRIPVWLDEGCPVIDDKLGKQLMEQIEANNFRLAGMKKIWKYGRREVAEDQCDGESVNDAMELSQLFPEVPHWLVGRIPGASTVDMSKVPFNRRQRRRLKEAGTRVLHLFSGEHTKTWMDMTEEGVAVICVEIEKGTNFLDDNLYAFLMDMAKDGLWDLITAGPPCRTVSLQRYREDGGPRPLRARHGVQRFGLSWNSAKQQEKCDQDSILWLRTMFLIYMGWKGNPKMETLVEQPSDPQIWLSHNRPRPQLGFASYLCWPETQSLMDMLQLREIHFDQGAVGHEHVKPTTLLSNCDEAKDLIGLRADMRQAVEWSPALYERIEESKKAAKWAPGIVEVIKRVINRKKGQSIFGPRPGEVRRNPGKYDAFLDSRRRTRERLGLPPMPDERLAIRAMDAKQLEDWKCHIANEHIPSRRDCEQCLRNMGRDRPHHRSKTPSAFCLNLDVTGPFKQGHDQCTGSGPRYIMVGVYTVPVHHGVPLLERLRELGAVHQGGDPVLGREHGGADRSDGAVPGQGGDQRTVPGQEGDQRAVPGQEGDQRAVPGQGGGRSVFPEPGGEAEDRGHQEDDEPLADPWAAPLHPGQGGCDAVPRGEPLGRQEGEDGAARRPAEEVLRPDLWAALDQGAPPDEGLSEVVIKELDLNNQRWREEVAQLQDVTVCNLTIALPLRSRHATDIVEVTSLMYGRLRSLGLPVHRVHSDRAREFTSKQFTAWLRQRDVVHTTTGGDEHQGCARAEGEINILKNRTRLLLDTSKADTHLWPLAIRHASEQRFREQLAALGVRLPRLIPFGSQGMARFKRWHHVKDKDVWQHPMQKVTIYGPAYDMSPTSNGYYVECDGRWMRSTVVIQPRSPEPIAGQTLVQAPADHVLVESDFLAVPEEAQLGDEIFDVVETDEGKVINDELEIGQDHGEGPRLTHRLHGKQTWPPVLRSIRTGGEWWSSQQEKIEEEEYSEQCKAQCNNVEEVYNRAALELLQLQEMRKVEKEEKAMMKSPMDAKLVLKVQKECNKLEHRLKALNKVEQEFDEKESKENQETLVTRSVTLEEVRRDLESWKDALQAEYKSLIEHGAIRPLSEEEVQQVKATNEEVISIPGMLVATLKPPSRRKARVVACGNYVQENHTKQEISAGGLDSIVTRSLVALAARKKWEIATADVKTAFLQAPRRATPGKATVISPPSILRDARVLQHGGGERWLVEKALYGLVESPRDWATYRDSQLKKMSWTDDFGEEVRIRPTAEPHLWEVSETKSKRVKAYLGVYVDDIMVVGEHGALTQVMQDLRRVFYMSPYEEVTEEHEVTFCGFEISKKEEAYVLRQEKYVGELMKRRQVQGRENHPLPKIVEDVDEECKDPKVIKECQAVIGELQWLATRTRPDLCYSTSLVARMIHRRPAYALGLCSHMLRYLAGHQAYGLRYGQDDEENVLHVRADTSFAPPHEQFRSVQGVAVYHGTHLLLWTSSRQAFITLSTAEGELLGYTEALQCGEAVGCLLDLLGYKTEKILEGDSKAALCQVQSDGGSWRTRHLRLRAWKLREVMNDVSSGWRSEHVPGCLLAADGLTKALQGQGHRKFVELLDMEVEDQQNRQWEFEKKLMKVNGVQQDYMHQVALVLATAGATMVLDASNQHLGMLMLMCSAVVKWWDGRKNNQKPMGNDQEPIGQTRKDEDPEKRNNKNPMEASRKERQDPYGTPKEKENGTQQDPEGTAGFSADSLVGKGGRRTPGLRAFRMSSKKQDEDEKRGAHGDAMAADSGASAGMATAAAYSSSTTSGPCGSRMDQRPGREEVVAVNVTKLAEDLQVRLQITRERKEETRVTVEQRPQSSAQGEHVPEVVIAEPMVMPTERVATGVGLYTVTGSTARFDDDETLRARKHEPWTLRRYAHPPVQVASDKWDETLLESDGWVIRSHGKLRKQTFHPLHRCTTIDIKKLHPQRMTVIFDSRGRQVVQDDWMNPKANTLSQVTERWRGYTFFRVDRSTEASGSGAQSSSSRATATRFGEGYPNDGRHAGEDPIELVSDGSFEKIDGS